MSDSLTVEIHEYCINQYQTIFQNLRTFLESKKKSITVTTKKTNSSLKGLREWGEEIKKDVKTEIGCTHSFQKEGAGDKTVDSRYLEFQGTIKYFEISVLRHIRFTEL